jgi:hypothetical protein
VNAIDKKQYLYEQATDVRQGLLFFRDERNDLQRTDVRMSSPQAASVTGGRSQVTAVPRKTISQKKFRPSTAEVLFKTISNKAYRYRLEKISGPGLYRPPLLRVIQNIGHRILSL